MIQKYDNQAFELITNMVERKELTWPGTSFEITNVPARFNWKTFRFEFERWELLTFYIYDDPHEHFPVFRSETRIYKTKAEAQQVMLLEKLEQ